MDLDGHTDDDALEIGDDDGPNGLDAGITAAPSTSSEEYRVRNEYYRDWRERMASWAPIHSEMMGRRRRFY